MADRRVALDQAHGKQTWGTVAVPGTGTAAATCSSGRAWGPPGNPLLQVSAVHPSTGKDSQ